MSDVCSCAALRQATRHLTRLYDQALAPAGLGLNQYSVLATLGRSGSQALQSLADLLVMDRSSLGHLLRPLEARGVVASGPDARDARQRIISLTEAGRALTAEAYPLWASVEEGFQATFGAEDARDLRRTLRRVTQVELRP